MDFYFFLGFYLLFISLAYSSSTPHLTPFFFFLSQFLFDLYSNSRGGILGDDMGLGKTIQTIAFLNAILAPAFGPRRALIVAPASVLSQWQEEMRKV